MQPLNLMSLFPFPQVGAAFLHFLWQGSALAGFLAILLPMCRSASARHNLSLAAVALMIAMPVVTHALMQIEVNTNVLAVFAPAWKPLGAGFGAVIPQDLTGKTWLEWIVVLWLVGVGIQLIRAVAGWHLMNELRNKGNFPLPVELSRRCQALQRRLGMDGVIEFFHSTRVKTPSVLGWLRPTVLIPATLDGRIPAVQWEALVAHELGHICRRDAFSNILLLVAETFLFFHPAIWWATHRVRIEREYCCDDMAVATSGDPGAYVEALASLEKWRTYRGLVLAAAAGNLKDRAVRLLDGQGGDPAGSQRWMIATLLSGYLTIGAATLVVASPTSPDVINQRVLSTCAGAKAARHCGPTWTASYYRNGSIIVRTNTKGRDGHQIFVLLGLTEGRAGNANINCDWRQIHSSMVVACVLRNVSPIRLSIEV
jgi:beta-lactamase regulating signal transducer with metallopeptidase domain